MVNNYTYIHIIYFIQEYSKLKLLSSLKINFGKESYLSNIYNIKLRKVVTQLRLSCHRLPVEIGRYQGVEHDNRLCKLCDMCVGDEKHCTMECLHPEPTKIRNNFLQNIFKKNSKLKLLSRDCLFKYILLFSDSMIVLETAEYIYDIFRLYNNK